MKRFAFFLYLLFPAFAIATSTVPQGGQFVINLRMEPPTLNPASSTTVAAGYVYAFTLDTLMERDANTYEWGPRVAEKWEVSKDGMIFTFHLNKKAVFSDGRPLTAEDVKFSFDMIFDPKFGNAHHRVAWETMDRAEIVDLHTIKFYAKAKYIRNLMNLGMLMILPKHIYSQPEKIKNVNKTVFGSGPYVIDNYEKGRKLVLKKNPKWFGWTEPTFKNWYNFDKIVFRWVGEPSVYLEMLKKGDFDFQTLNADIFHQASGPEWEKNVVKVKADSQESKPIWFVKWNLKRDLFRDKNVRVALAHLMNREEMNKKLFFGESILSTGPFHRTADFAPKDIQPYEYSPAKAQALLKKSGWADTDKDGLLDKVINGEKRKFSFQLIITRKDHERYFTWYQEDLKKAGIELVLQQMDFNTADKKLDDRNFDAIYSGYTLGLDWDPKFVWHSSSDTKGGSNNAGYANPQVDAWIDEARVTLDRSKRVKILQKVYRQISEDAPYLFMFDQKYSYYVRSKRVKAPVDSFKYDVGIQYWWSEDGAGRNP